VEEGKRPDSEGVDLVEVLYKEYFPTIYRLGFRLLGNSEQALDLTQEVFLKLYRRLNGGPPVTEIKGWLYRTAANLSYDWLRRKCRFQKISASRLERTEKDVEQELIDAEAIQAVREALEQLPPRDRILLVLYLDELSYDEISKATGFRKSSVGTFISRAINRLAKELEKGEKP
jgi:RNA polymerase sigma-70 factor (ECF subfamily)